MSSRRSRSLESKGAERPCEGLEKSTGSGTIRSSAGSTITRCVSVGQVLTSPVTQFPQLQIETNPHRVVVRIKQGYPNKASGPGPSTGFDDANDRADVLT